MSPTIKEKEICHDPLFLRFINKEISSSDLALIFSRSSDPYTVEVASKAVETPPDIEKFRIEMTEAVHDIISKGLDEDFKAFVNHYMSESLVEDVAHQPSQFGENISRSARIKDADSPWVEGFLCYNLCLYIKAFGLGSLKSCRVCHKFFAHKGQYAVYCSDQCKSAGKVVASKKEP